VSESGNRAPGLDQTGLDTGGGTSMGKQAPGWAKKKKPAVGARLLSHTKTGRESTEGAEGFIGAANGREWNANAGTRRKEAAF